MDYNFSEIEKKWQQYWRDNQVYKVDIDKSRPKFYVLDMFPYPSGAGLHVGHPLGYIASDIYSRYKRLRGYNVLHPMGYDAFGLPAEQYAIQTGTHPAITTENNITRYREQLDKIGFSFDWNREVRTSDPQYYKWTQWTFIQLFHHWYDKDANKARPVKELIELFETEGNAGVNAACGQVESFSAADWMAMGERRQQEILMQYRLAYLDNTMVNWCPALGTVLANDEVSEGLSVRGGHPVERKSMKQWLLRITAYADRLLEGLETIDWSDSLKEIQRNWIGKSTGGAIRFRLDGYDDFIEVFTTRPDTIFGATFMVLAPEHELVERITTVTQKAEVEAYVQRTKNRSERERMAEVKKVSGAFTGAYAINPFTNEKIPVWIADYVLMGYGTGAIMAVPAHDSRDFAFARHFDLPIVQVISKTDEEPSDPMGWSESYDSKEGVAINSGFINGLEVKAAIEAVVAEAEKRGIGTKQINYRLRDAIFSRQRYWGEPFPVYYKDGMPYTIPEDMLPLELPPVDAYLPTETGEPPLARAKNWTTPEGYPLETNTMPGFAGSSGYYLRYMDPHNHERYFSEEAIQYWENVDLYIGGAEHATGHLIYARFWNMFLFDLGMTVQPEPFRKLINQGMIQGRSNFVYRIAGTNTFVSAGLRQQYEVQALHVDVNLVHNDQLDTEAFRQWQPQFADAEFIFENGRYICGWEVEKMSKSKYNVQNPDDLIEKYGADTLRMYEMFLGPLEQSKPWDTQGIEGVFRFIRKLWRLFHDENNKPDISEAPATEAELRVLHRTIRKVEDDIERFSFNTAVSAFMICVNELTELHCRKREILQPLTILVSAYAPHIAEELWNLLGNERSVVLQQWPQYKEEYLSENTFTYPVSFNGKTRFKITLPVDMPTRELEKAALDAPETARYTEGKPVRKVIVVPNRIINIVI
ncbi:MAG TPA: leucine--tRNA ligase [Bacteroidales bacterium]|nr:leucine--tRNA ligase [Bacteroidales bacterium]